MSPPREGREAAHVAAPSRPGMHAWRVPAPRSISYAREYTRRTDADPVVVGMPERELPAANERSLVYAPRWAVSQCIYSPPPSGHHQQVLKTGAAGSLVRARARAGSQEEKAGRRGGHLLPHAPARPVAAAGAHGGVVASNVYRNAPNTT